MEKVKRAQLIVRQHSKVEKIPDEESEELLLKKVEAKDNGQEEKTVEQSLSLKISRISNKNTRACSKKLLCFFISRIILMAKKTLKCYNIDRDKA